MTILDTSIVINRIREKKSIQEDITAVTLVEYPRTIFYKHFCGGIIFPIRDDFIPAHRIQLELLKVGKPQAFADLLVAAIAVNRDEELITRDRDFMYIRQAVERIGYHMKLKLK